MEDLVSVLLKVKDAAISAQVGTNSQITIPNGVQSLLLVPNTSTSFIPEQNYNFVCFFLVVIIGLG